MRALDYLVKWRGRRPEHMTFHDDLRARRFGAANLMVDCIAREKGGVVVYRYVPTKKRAAVISWAA